MSLFLSESLLSDGRKMRIYFRFCLSADVSKCMNGVKNEISFGSGAKDDLDVTRFCHAAVVTVPVEGNNAKDKGNLLH